MSWAYCEPKSSTTTFSSTRRRAGDAASAAETLIGGLFLLGYVLGRMPRRPIRRFGRPSEFPRVLASDTRRTERRHPIKRKRPVGLGRRRAETAIIGLARPGD